MYDVAHQGRNQMAANAPIPIEPVRPSRRDWLISVSTLLLGTAVVAFLTRYNHQPAVVWSRDRFAPAHSWEEYLVVNMTGLVFLPFLMLLGLFREEAAGFGFALPARGIGRIAGLFFLVMLPVLLFVSRQPDFRMAYPLQPQAAFSWGYFVYFEVTYGFYLFCWEFFYRGFLTFGLARALGAVPAVVLQALAFGIMHWGKPVPEFISSFFGGAILGWLALRARSFFPGFLLHWSIAFTLDLFAIHAKPGGIL